MSEMLLQSLFIFSDLTPAELKTLKPYLQDAISKAGEVIFKPGSVRDRLRIVKSGKVELQALAGEADWDELSTLFGPGQFMGEASLLKEGTLHRATCTALTEVRFYLLRRESFMKLFA